jgi:hypothetical protein
MLSVEGSNVERFRVLFGNVSGRDRMKLKIAFPASLQRESVLIETAIGGK